MTLGIPVTYETTLTNAWPTTDQSLTNIFKNKFLPWFIRFFWWQTITHCASAVHQLYSSVLHDSQLDLPRALLYGSGLTSWTVNQLCTRYLHYLHKWSIMLDQSIADSLGNKSLIGSLSDWSENSFPRTKKKLKTYIKCFLKSCDENFYQICFIPPRRCDIEIGLNFNNAAFTDQNSLFSSLLCSIFKDGRLSVTILLQRITWKFKIMLDVDLMATALWLTKVKIFMQLIQWFFQNTQENQMF